MAGWLVDQLVLLVGWLLIGWLWLANGFGWSEIGQDRRIARSRVRRTFGSVGWLWLLTGWLWFLVGWLTNGWLLAGWLARNQSDYI
jgi:hypothetical protein